ncbi:MAG: hypothetical protein E3J86_03975 [Candidatus Thorarchaeota archaeon]|nr:MAG: hypothetical protein E3J86_03975 [Candidatus Thorarchaeota archaeon]
MVSERTVVIDINGALGNKLFYFLREIMEFHPSVIQKGEDLKVIIDNREKDITYLESELKEAKDRIADLEDELGK